MRRSCLYRRAHAQLARIGQPQDVAAALSNMAMVYSRSQRFSASARQSTARRASTASVHAMPLLVLQADYNIAYLYYLRGEYARALELYRTAQEKCDGLGETYHQRALRSGSIGNLSGAESQRRGGRPRLTGARALRQAGHGVRGGEGRDERRHRDEQPGRAAARAEAVRSGARALRARAESGLARARRFLRGACAVQERRPRAAPGELCRTALSLFAHASAPGRAGLCELLLARLELEAGELGARRARLCRRLRDAVVGADAEPHVSGALRPRPDPRGARRQGIGVCSLPGGPSGPRTPSQSSSGRRSQSRFPAGQAGGVREPGRHVPRARSGGRQAERQRSATSRKRSPAALPISWRFAPPRWRRACPAR